MTLAGRTRLLAAAALAVSLAILAGALRLASGGRTLLALAAAIFAALLLFAVPLVAVRRFTHWLDWLARVIERGDGGEEAADPAPPEVPDEVAALAGRIDRREASWRRRAARARERARALEAALAGMRDGVLLVDRELRVRLANRALRELLDLDDPAGRPVTEIVRDPDLRAALVQALETGRESQLSLRLPQQPGRTFEVQVGADRDEALALFHDVTRLERLESVRREFVANVSHELRTPLSAIRAYVETLLEEAEPDAPATRHLETIARHTARMEALVGDLTDLSRIETGAVELVPEPVDAAAAVRTALGQLERSRREADVSASVELPEGLTVPADPRRLEQILVNLLDNAIKFNRPGGRVTVRGARRGDTVELVVEDTGEGIAPEHRERIFHRFFQADPARSRERGGTGLGLAIVKHLMELHGGRVRCESVPGQGSRFLLEFPARRESEG